MTSTSTDSLGERLRAAVVPQRAGRCCFCGNRYSAKSLETIRVGGKWHCLACAQRWHSGSAALASREVLLHDLTEEQADWRAMHDRNEVAAPATPNVIIRWMLNKDINEVLAIEQDVFEFPYSREELICLLREQYVLGMTVESAGKVVGYFIYEILNRPQRHNEILSFAVARGAQRQGIGSRIIQRMIDKMSDANPTLTCRVRESNLIAQLFLQSHGFKATHIEKGFYEPDETTEPAYFFCYGKPLATAQK